MMASDVSVPAAVVPAAVIIKPHFALFYDYVPDVLERRQPHRQAHLALVKDFKERGKFVMGGAMADPVDSALIVFTDRHSAESFALEDPYVSCAAVAALPSLRPSATAVSLGLLTGTFRTVSSLATVFESGPPLCCRELGDCVTQMDSLAKRQAHGSKTAGS